MIAKDKTGVVLAGILGSNPVSGRGFPLIVADYVLASYGSGAVMGVPAHDDRDRELAEAFAFPIVECIKDSGLINSDRFDGMTIEAARPPTQSSSTRKRKSNFKMRDCDIFASEVLG